MEAITKRNHLPEWIDSFVNAFSTTHRKELEKEAEINVKTLPKVVWNDNTFYVSLSKDDACADIFNTYGNVVTSLKNVESIEDVEKSLNKKVIAASNDIHNLYPEYMSQTNTKISNEALEDALPKVAKQLGLSDDATIQEIEDKVNQNLVSSNNEDNTSEKYAEQINQLIKKADNTQRELDYYKKEFNKLASSFDKLSNTVNQLADSMYARKDPGNVYDIGAEQAEIQHFNETANNTAKGIMIEHNVDLTSPQGRTSLQDRILNDINSLQLPDEFVKEIKQIDETKKNDNELVQEEHNKPDVELVESDRSSLLTNTNVNNNSSKDSQIVINDNTDNTDIKVDIELKSSEDKKLNDKEASLFKKQICPICNNKSLFRSNRVASVQNVVCHKCNSTFGVDLSNENIFVR